MIISEMEVGRMGNKDKTNVMRVLEQKKVPYKGYSFPEVTATNGVEIAGVLGENPDQVFKTLVTCGKTKAYYVFVIPVARELDLKKAAKAVGEKSIAMIPQKELLPLTGYVHGGCSPIGMKKQFPTVFHETARDLPTIYFSAGKIAHQVEVAPVDLDKALRFTYADVCGE
jgi:Cys-tRNA(Pro)/Cys-tRNA(Cys) deacylase